MGLCKCPKRKVTNQFCYEHRVNVCEHCVVAHHPKCVVQSYLLWLQDSDYDSTCLLCKESLSSDDCIRFLCYHVFHWACIDKYIRSLPETTAPAGYKCPTCKEPILPKQNVLSPVADALREKISSVNWARSSLGLPMLTEEKYKNPGKNIQPASTVNNNSNFEKQNHNGNTADEIIHVEDTLYSRSEKSAQLPRRNLHTESEKVLFEEEDESKYRRRYPLPAISNWLKFVGSELIMLKNGPRRKCKIIILIILAFCLLCYILSIWGSMVTSDSPSLDPHNNPFVRVQEEKL